MSNKISAETYLVLVPDISSNGQYVHGIRADRIRASKPSLKAGEIVVKLRLSFERSQLLDTISIVALDINSFSAFQPSVVDITSEVAADVN